MPAPDLEVRGIGKSFPGVRALHQVDLHLARGEALGLIGENGAGKSTLMKILAGVQPPDEGEILLDGVPVRFDGVVDSLAAGIFLVHQELNLATNLTVAENLFLGREKHGSLGLVRQAEMNADTARFLQSVGLDVDPRTPVGELSIGKQQLVEIAKGLSFDARVMIMDEPTSSLSQGEAERLYEVIRDLSAKGVAVIYVSHRLGEVKELADRVTVLRDGANSGDLDKAEITHDAMVQLMVGRELSQYYPHKEHPAGEVVLEARGIRTSEFPEHEISFSIRSGEVVGIAGLVGAGRTALVRTLFGADLPLAGELRVRGKALALGSPGDAIEAGIALVPEDRKAEGLLLAMNIRDNVSLAALRRDARGGLRNVRAEVDLGAEMIGRLRIKTPSDQQECGNLSGGNQQKVALGKWLALRPRVLILDEPTRGVDIGAKQEIYAIMEDLARDGVAVLFVSSEMEEILGMSDRALVMHEGRLTGELGRKQLSEEAVMRLATSTNPVQS